MLFHLQIVSTYQSPDVAELNYHAGTATRSPACALTAIHSGVQFTDLQHADLCTAMLLLVACKYPSQELENVRYDIDSSKLDVFFNFMESGDVDLNFMNGYCKTIVNKVTLICICNTPWIEGSTLVAMYGEMHVAFKCSKWYHTYCLKY